MSKFFFLCFILLLTVSPSRSQTLLELISVQTGGLLAQVATGGTTGTTTGSSGTSGSTQSTFTESSSTTGGSISATETETSTVSSSTVESSTVYSSTQSSTIESSTVSSSTVESSTESTSASSTVESNTVSTTVSESTTVPPSSSSVPPSSSTYESTADSSTSSGSTGEESLCPPGQYEAWGQCYDNFEQCVSEQLKNCSGTFFNCADQSCAEAPTDCTDRTPACESPKTKCWDGRCVLSSSDCEVFPACPFEYPRRCRSFLCIGINDICFGEDNNFDCPGEVCPDGSCAPCADYNGCPLNKPVMCPNGVCTSTEANCYCTAPGIQKGFMCFDGTCVSEIGKCNRPPFTVKPAVITYPFHPTDGSLFDVVSDVSGEAFLRVQVPMGSFVVDDNSTFIAVRSVPDSKIRKIKANMNSDIFKILSPVVDLTTSSKVMMPFREPISLTFNVAMTANLDISTLRLAFINGDQWEVVDKMPEVTLSANGQYFTVKGKTTHFTSYAVLVDPFVDPDQVPKEQKDGDMKIYYIVGASSGVGAIAIGGIAVLLYRKKVRGREERAMTLIMNRIAELSEPVYPTNKAV